jgi:FtsH-binding integral membrane protein
MRRLPLILGISLIVAMTVWEVYAFFVTNEGVRYFSSEPQRLLPVVLLGLAGGVVAFGISRLSPGSQRTLKLTALGTLGTVFLCALGFLAYSLARLVPIVSEEGGWGWMAVAFLAFAVMAALVWLEFRQVWRRT